MKTRLLEPSEHGRLAGIGPFEKCGPDPASSMVIVAEDEDGEILGYWCAFNAVHLEPLWVVDGERNNGVGMALWHGLREVLEEQGVANAFAMVGDEDTMTHLPLANKLGFKKLPVSTLFIQLSDKADAKEGLVRGEEGS